MRRKQDDVHRPDDQVNKNTVLTVQYQVNQRDIQIIIPQTIMT